MSVHINRIWGFENILHTGNGIRHRLIVTTGHTSIQVQPVKRRLRANFKVWCIEEIGASGTICIGFNDMYSIEQIQQAIYTDELPSLMNEFTPEVGKFYYVPNGIANYIGPQMRILETAPVNETYRIYDWGRQCRQLHVSEGLAALIPNGF